MEYRYALEKLRDAIKCIANLGEGTDAPDRLSKALNEIHLAKNDIYNDPEATKLFEELFSLIDFSKTDPEKGVFKRNFEEMNYELRLYVLDLMIQLYALVIILSHGDFKEAWAEHPMIEERKSKIKKTYKEIPDF